MDKEYWDKFYAEHGLDSNIHKESTFAKFCQEELFIGKKLNILELGSGNGRDSIFFAKNNHKVIAIDQSTVAIDIEKNNLPKDICNNLIAKADNFITEDYSCYGDIDIFYSRFTIHAIKKDEEQIIVSKVYNQLDTHGLFCIEVRTTKDPLCGIGKYMGDNTYFTDHSRRFIDSDIFLKNALNLGFKLKYFVEKDNLSIYKNDNPVLMRIILEKP